MSDSEYPGARVCVYPNVRAGCWSVRRSGNKKLIAHRDRLFLFDCLFVVNRGNWRRWKTTGTAPIHAFVRGTWEPSTLDPAWFAWHRVVYRPGRGRFVAQETGRVLYEAPLVECRPDGTYWAVLRLDPSVGQVAPDTKHEPAKTVGSPPLPPPGR